MPSSAVRGDRPERARFGLFSRSGPGLFPIELDGVPNCRLYQNQGQRTGSDRKTDIKQQESVSGDIRAGVAQRDEVADDQKNSEVGGSESPVREMKRPDRDSGEIDFDREHEIHDEEAPVDRPRD